VFILQMMLPTLTISPTLNKISTTEPATSDSTSAVAFSNSISATGSPFLILSPIFTFHCKISTSVVSIPILGTVRSCMVLPFIYNQNLKIIVLFLLLPLPGGPKNTLLKAVSQSFTLAYCKKYIF